MGAVAMGAALITPACGVFAETCGAIAAGAGNLSTGLAGAAALSYFAGGDAVDGESNAVAFGIGAFTFGMGNIIENLGEEAAKIPWGNRAFDAAAINTAAFFGMGLPRPSLG
jgi:hypothetical protein